MSIGDHMKEFGGLPAFALPDLEKKKKGGKKRNKKKDLPATDSVAWRIGQSYYDDEESWEDKFARFLDTVDTTRVRALIVGQWTRAYDHGPETVIAALIAAGDKFPALRSVFLGDIVMEENEISWIHQGLVTPLLEAFPDLEEFGVRGGEGLEFPAVRHERLRRLTLESGGLPAEAVRGIAASDFPALTHLDLWLGTSEYGGDAVVDDLAPILAGTRLPNLKHLALRNSEIQDEICTALAAAPVVARLESLDISMGVLTDDGVAALLTGQPLSHLKSLDMHYNYLTDPMRERVRATLEPAGVELDLHFDDAEQDDDEDGTVWRFVAVGE
ncbi:STM4015 family protein [Nocardia sp. NPDC005366]|uniref:STM4015 family protein n=1 Tax=Nocardia sp. NPDC005366 TaxID=3156878 RepID=UPI0033AEDE42